MASASTSNTPFDIFINHRGPDVKTTLARRLYRTLKSRGLQVFLDQPELEAGYNIPSQIEAAIQVASVHIAIFSPNYAISKWCLDELVLMLDSRGTILPVFYKVKPFELRWTDKGAYAEALRQHEEKQRYDLKTIGDWKKALSQVADISGFELEACNWDEVELLDQVVERVLKLVPKPPLYVAKYRIGLQEKLEDFERAVLSHMEEEQRLEAKVVGIVGSGGIGKSTLAREFFNSKRSNYDVSSFLFDVRENAATKSLTHLQSQLIEDLKGKAIQIKSPEEGIGILERYLKSCYALIILDDVDHRDQMKFFLPIKHVLHPNSLILVTSRDKKVLRSEGMVDSSIYQLKGLNTPHSLELFCWHAFSQRHPLPGFEDLAYRFVEACDGLPLSLEVFGALMLCEENDKSYWEEQLNGLEKLPNEIQVRLKISFDSLEPEEQQLFIDIAWFAIGEKKDKWIRIWGWSGCKGSVGLRNLENKCLVDVDNEMKIRMHDHLRHLGRDIALEGSTPHSLLIVMINTVYIMVEQCSSRGASCGSASIFPISILVITIFEDFLFKKPKIYCLVIFFCFLFCFVVEVRGIIMAPWGTHTDIWEGRMYGVIVFVCQLLTISSIIEEGMVEASFRALLQLLCYSFLLFLGSFFCANFLTFKRRWRLSNKRLCYYLFFLSFWLFLSICWIWKRLGLQEMLF